MALNEEQQAALNEASVKFNEIVQEKGKRIEKIHNEHLIPLIRKATNYQGNLSIHVEAHGKIRLQNNQLVPDDTSIATLVFEDEMPSDQTDPMGFAEEYVQRMLAKKFFEEAIESMNN